MDRQSLVITCAITGAETTRDKQPNLPVTPDEQANAAYDAIAAGASVIHLHVREDDGKPSQRVERFKQAISAIKAKAPDVIIQISTGGAVGEPIDKRVQPLALKPEMASLNLGTMNFGEEIFYNHPRDIMAMAAKMHKTGIIPELEIYDVGMLESAFRLAKQGILREPLNFQFVLGVPGGMSGEPENLVYLVSILKKYGHGKTFHWGVAGIGRNELPLAVQAIVMGGHVRVGFEDNIFYHKGELAKSNAQLVARIKMLSEELGRRVAEPVEARKLLGIS
ncbi:MAG: 3-keto-5-aminohexanoate cleavage protein [Bdellovibrionota bacterium]